MTFAAAERAYLTPPDEHPTPDDPGSTCPGPLDPCEHLIPSEDGGCSLCGGAVCPEHDDTDGCDGFVVHAVCHDRGCCSPVCAQDRHDDALLAAQEERDGR